MRTYRPDELPPKVREVYELWRDMGLSESAAVDAAMEGEPRSAHDQLVGEFKAMGLSEAGAEVAACGRPGSTYSGTFDQAAGDRRGSWDTSPSADIDTANRELLRRALTEAAPAYRAFFNLASDQAGFDYALTEARQYILKFDAPPERVANHIKGIAEAYRDQAAGRLSGHRSTSEATTTTLTERGRVQ